MTSSTSPLQPASADGASNAGEGLAAGARLGKYEILERVGKGGMAVIYRARDPLLNRIVAIKQIGAHLADDSRWRDRFRQEAQVIARIAVTSRHVVNIHELVEDPRGLFIVMEFVEGHSLATLIRENRVDLQTGLDVLAGVCLGLRAVHAAGIIHRDIKPGNIIVPPDRRAKIADFGLAAPIGSEASMALGTTKYMAPELFQSGPIDCRVDIYSLGLVAFEMFAGREAYDRLFADLRGDGRSEAMRWMNWHLRTDLVLPRLDTLNPLIPPMLAEIVAQMAAKSLGVRYASIDAIIYDLKRSFPPGAGAAPTVGATSLGGASPAKTSGGGVSGASAAAPTGPVTGVFEDEAPTAPMPVPSPLRKVRRKHVIWAGSALAAVIVIVVGLAMHRSSKLETLRQVFGEGVAAYRAADFATAVARYREAAQMDVSGSEAAEGRKRAAQGLALAEAQAARLRGDFAEALAKLKEAEERLGVQRGVIEPVRVSVLEAQEREEAKARFAQLLADGELEQASTVIRDLEERALLDSAAATEMKDQLEQARGRSTYFAQLRKARQALERGEFDNALKFAQAAEALQPTEEAAGLLKSIRLERQYGEEVKKGDEALAVADFKTAAMHYLEANRLKPSAVGESRYKRVKAREHLAAGQVARDAGRLLDARMQFEESLKHDELPEARRGLDRVVALLSLQEQIDAGQKAADSGDWEEALEKWQAALDAAVPDRADEIRAKVALAQLQVAIGRGDRLAAQKQWTEARQAYEEALRLGGGDDVKRRIREMELNQQIAALLEQGDAARDAGRFAQALKLYRDALKLRQGDGAIQGRIDDVNYRQFKASGTRKFQAGQYRAALADLRQALRLRPEDADLARMVEEAEKRASEEPGGG